MSQDLFETGISREIWDSRYRYRLKGAERDHDLSDSWDRVATALAEAEPGDRLKWQQNFFRILQGFRFLPGGRILAGAGTEYDITLFNCFVMGQLTDSMEGIFSGLKEGALTMQQGGGVGYDFSPLRPAGSVAWRTGGVASGPVSFMRIWDCTCDTLLSTATRRGAMMATLRCDHPDIEAFVDAKRKPGELRNFNLSVLVSDAFMQAVKENAAWPLVFPATAMGDDEDHDGRKIVYRNWPGQTGSVACQVIRELPARDLLQRIVRASYDCAEPGVLFIDRINHENNLGYREVLGATNPCGEVPLPPYGACNLGSLNLTSFVLQPFSDEARFDLEALAAATKTAVRLLDNVIDVSRFPLPQQKEQAQGSRRIGLGMTGLADALIMLGLHYGSEAGRQQAARAMQTICHSAYRASVNLASEKGSFPWLDREACLQRPFIRRLPVDIQRGIAEHGLRNSHLTAIAPTGTISLLANNISSGIEPVFDFEYRRRLRNREGEYVWHDLQDFALRRWRCEFGQRSLPDYFVNAHSLPPRDHLAMQAVLQPLVDGAISKTINVPRDCDFESFRSLYDEAFRLGLKGCTTFRPNSLLEAVLQKTDLHEPKAGAHCCALERDND